MSATGRLQEYDETVESQVLEWLRHDHEKMTASALLDELSGPEHDIPEEKILKVLRILLQNGSLKLGPTMNLVIDE